MVFKTLSRLFILTHKTPLSQKLCSMTKPSQTQTQTQNLERIVDELISLSKLERYDYTILLRHKMGLNKYGPAVLGLQSISSSDSCGTTAAAEEKNATEKVVFDVKLEKYDVNLDDWVYECCGLSCLDHPKF